MARIGHQTVRFAEALLKLCNFEITGRQTTVSLSKGLGFPTHSVLPCPLVVPLQSNLTVNLPSTTGQKGKKHNPFPLDQPTLQSNSYLVLVLTLLAFEDEVDIMNSMQKPRKITVRGSDGVRYPFLVKPKDDLRKDARLMEFNSIINKLLKKNPESSRRQLCNFSSTRLANPRYPNILGCSTERRTRDCRMGASY
jgi:serine/threonine-protein kinase ATR